MNLAIKFTDQSEYKNAVEYFNVCDFSSYSVASNNDAEMKIELKDKHGLEIKKSDLGLLNEELIEYGFQNFKSYIIC